MQNNINIVSRRFKAMRRGLMPKVGALALQFVDDRFREQGWKDNRLKPWTARKNNSDPGRAILVKSGRLKRGNRIITTSDHSVTLGNDVPYARAHNEGMHGTVQVRAHTRRRSVESRKRNVKRKDAYKYIDPVNVRPHGMMMNMPERRFMGNSHYLRGKLKRMIAEEVKQCFR